jgi:hypothetical protein
MVRAATGPAATPAPSSRPRAVGAAPAARSIKPRERRAGRREQLTMLGVLTAPDAPDKPLEVAVLNVGPRGCAFRSPVPFRPGTVYAMRIGTGSLHLTSTLRIISSRDRADGLYDVGAKFV